MQLSKKLVSVLFVKVKLNKFLKQSPLYQNITSSRLCEDKSWNIPFKNVITVLPSKYQDNYVLIKYIQKGMGLKKSEFIDVSSLFFSC